MQDARYTSITVSPFPVKVERLLMETRRKIISILVDGMSADTVAEHGARFPNLARLAESGFVVRRLRSTMPGTSVPGRATMLTGASADVHGVYGNHIFEGQTFRAPRPSDLRVPTIAKLATDHGLDVASIGHGMVDPAHTNICVSPWWLRSFLLGSRFAKTVPDALLRETRSVKDPEGRLAQAGVIGLERFLNPRSSAAPALVSGLVGDQFMIRATAALARSRKPPDLILTEINMPDAFQHDYGFHSEAALWSAEFADLLVGFLLNELALAGRSSEYAIVVASDHGHGPIETAIFPDAIIPGRPWMSEGATLHVAVRNDADQRQVADAFEPYGVTLWDNNHLPPDSRDELMTFIAPPMHDFEEWPDAAPTRGAPTGKPRYSSSHGFRPGSPQDDRIFIASGPGIRRQKIEQGGADQYAPTLARLLGLPTEAFAGLSLETII